MSRSTDMPFADDPLAEDPLLAELRAARPEAPADLLDPHAPANAALLQAIVGDTAGGIDEPHSPRWRRALPRVVAGAAAAALVAGLVVAWPFGSPEPSAADVVHRAAVASASALDSGRATVTVTSEQTTEGGPPSPLPDPDGSSTDTFEYRFAGDDVAVAMVFGGGYPGERRIVDGEMYWHAGPDPSTPWFHHVDGGPSRSDWTGDPRSLLATLEPRAGFELVDDDTADGTHLRSTTPSNFVPGELGLGQALDGAGVLTGLDVWVDDDGVVGRIDIASTSTYDVMVLDDAPGQADRQESITQVTTATVRFTDVGVPNAIEAPATSCDVTDQQMTDPPPPGTPVC
jgi:hypothetical protein